MSFKRFNVSFDIDVDEETTKDDVASAITELFDCDTVVVNGVDFSGHLHLSVKEVE